MEKSPNRITNNMNQAYLSHSRVNLAQSSNGASPLKIIYAELVAELATPECLVMLHYTGCVPTQLLFVYEVCCLMSIQSKLTLLNGVIMNPRIRHLFLCCTSF